MSSAPASLKDAGPFGFDPNPAMSRQIMDSAALGMALVGADSAVLYGNSALERMGGLAKGGSVGRSLETLILPEDSKALMLRVDQVLRGETDKFSLDCRLQHSDGSSIWVIASGSLLHDANPDSMPACILQLVDIDQRKHAEEAVMRSERRLTFALEAAGQGVWDYDARRDEIFHSASWRTMRGLGPTEEIDPSRDEWFARLHPDDLERVSDIVDKQERGEDGFDRMEYRERHRDGHYVWILSRGRPVEWDDHGNRTRAVGTDTDITYLKAIEGQLADEKERFRTTLEAIADGVISTDAEGRIIFMNPSAEAMTGWPVAEAAGHSLMEIFNAKSESTGERAASPVEACLTSGAPAQVEEDVVLASRDGTGRGISGTASPVRSEGGRLIGAVLVFKDVTATQELQRKLEHSANYDMLTGLPNRSVFNRALIDARREAADDGRSHALCFIDLDRFKPVNDSAGHAAGDALLKIVARAIRRSSRSHDVAARLGGDEFVLLLSDCSLANAAEVAKKIVAAIARIEFTWNEVSYTIGASIGVAPVTADPQRDPLIEADASCYAAKAAGRGQVIVGAQ